MARIKVPFKGVTSQSNHQDGECKNIVNLRPERGRYKPVTPRKVVRPMADDYGIVFVHRGDGYENWIGVKSGNELYYNINDEPIEIYWHEHGINWAIIKGIEQVGNTLIILTTEGLQYILWSNSEYKFLGKLPDLPPIKFGLSPETVDVKLWHENVLGEMWFYAASNISDTYDRNEEFKRFNIAMLNKARQRIVEGKFSSGETVGLRLFDAHIVRYAFRLYDGSIIKHSAPILIMPSNGIEYLNRLRIHTRVVDGELDYDESYVTVTGYDFAIAYDFSTISIWSDIIKSVDIFISQPLGLTSEELIKPLGGASEEESLFEMYSDRQIENIKNSSLFYHSHSLDLVKSPLHANDPPQSFCSTFRSTITKLSDIPYQELMPVDSLSHHNIEAENSSVYNNRLRLSSITTHLFGGFDGRHFCWHSSYNGENSHGFPINMHWLNIIVEIDTSEGLKRVQNTFLVSQYDLGWQLINPYLSYPDPRAVRMIFVLSNQDNSVIKSFSSVDLKKHPSLNIAYYLNTTLKPFPYLDGIETPTQHLPNAYVRTFEPNKIKVSEVNNPFVFPNENTYQVGSGEILAESSIIMNVSDRNYGMYPVFVFTTDGVFTMSGQDAETVHASIQAPTYIEPPISKVICATPYGVVFVTKRGLMQISNHGTAFLSQVLREDDEVLSIDMTGVVDNILKYPTASLRDDLKSIQNMVYNPYDDELIISVGKPYNYVYDYETKSFYLSTNVIEQLVQNTYPDVLYITDNNLIDISKQESKSAQISIITRPIQFETADIKKLDRIFLRGLIYNANNMSVAAYHSIDGVNYSPIKGFKFGSGANYKDYDLGMLARETYRQYIFLLTGTIDEESQLEYVEFEVDKNYNNDKMR